MPSDPPFTPTFLAVKLVDIGLVTMYYFVFGIIAAKLFDKFYGKFDKEDYEKKSTILVFFEIILHLFFIGVSAYVLRNAVQLIPYPFEGVAGFKHLRLKELDGGYVLSVILVLFQKNLMGKISYFAKRVIDLPAE
jgi:hypothetical protein